MNKRKGTRNEHRSMRLLEGMGYSCTRAAVTALGDPNEWTLHDLNEIKLSHG